MSKLWPEGPTHLEGFDTWVQTLILMRFMRRGGGKMEEDKISDDFEAKVF